MNMVYLINKLTLLANRRRNALGLWCPQRHGPLFHLRVSDYCVLAPRYWEDRLDWAKAAN
jgi:hypothetical protein